MFGLPIMLPAIGGALNWLSNTFKEGQARDEERQRIKDQERIRQENVAREREFAQHGLRWRVNDARAAGISPLAALGASTSQPMSQPLGDSSVPYQPDNSISIAGQDISRAMAAASTDVERAYQLLQAKLLETQIEGQKIDNAYKLKQLSPTPSSPGLLPGQSVNIVPDYTYSRSDDGALSVVPSPEVKPLIEDMFSQELQWESRNLSGDSHGYPMTVMPGKDKVFKWVSSRKQWVPTTINNSEAHYFRNGNWYPVSELKRKYQKRMD